MPFSYLFLAVCLFLSLAVGPLPVHSNPSAGRSSRVSSNGKFSNLFNIDTRKSNVDDKDDITIDINNSNNNQKTRRETAGEEKGKGFSRLQNQLSLQQDDNRKKLARKSVSNTVIMCADRSS